MTENIFSGPPSSVEQRLIEAVHSQKAGEVALRILNSDSDELSSKDRSLIESVLACCATITSQVDAQAQEMSSKLDDAGVEAVAPDHSDRPCHFQHHSFTLHIPQRDVSRAINTAVDAGFRPDFPPHPAALEAMRRCHTSASLVRNEDATIRMLLVWGNDKPLHPAFARARPSLADFAALKLPKPLWPLYFVTKPARVAFERITNAKPRYSMGKFLATPAELTTSILEFAAVKKDDVVADIGCGDGRILVEAASHWGCEVIGVETEPYYASLAREAIARAGLNSLARIEEADGASADISGANLVFLFLPSATLSRLVPELMQRLGTGVRIVAHEQAPISVSTPPSASRLIVGRAALTVAHIWTAKG